MNNSIAPGLHPGFLSMDTNGYDVDALKTELVFQRHTRIDAGGGLKRMINKSLDRLPLPGHGNTLLRWRSLAAVAGCDLSLAKLFEGHTDALAILAELHGDKGPLGSRWAVWAAEPPGARVHFRCLPDGSVRLAGLKAWCSGAASVTHGLLTAWLTGDSREDIGPFLVAVDMNQAGVAIINDGWQAVGMAGSASIAVRFNDARADVIGEQGDYLQRPGFWHGGAGIAACWYGAAAALAEPLRKRVAVGGDAHSSAHLGAVDVALQESSALLRQAAEAIDQEPTANAQLLAMRVRASSERTATQVLDHVGRALGATPFCRDAAFARRAADLPVFLRQSHAERDLQALGERLATGIESELSPWAL